MKFVGTIERDYALRFSSPARAHRHFVDGDWGDNFHPIKSLTDLSEFIITELHKAKEGGETIPGTGSHLRCGTPRTGVYIDGLPVFIFDADHQTYTSEIDGNFGQIVVQLGLPTLS